MVSNVASVFPDLEPGDFYLLSGLEHGMRFSEWVKESDIPQFSQLDTQDVTYRLDRCMDRELVERKTIQYTGYQLTFEGYDALALRTFTERDTFDEFGAPLGVGKESDVYEVRSYKPLALKYHREGYTQFREVQKEREYTADREHVSWLYTARKAAEREHGVLETLYPDVSVPRPIDHNRHAIVMEKLPGVELANAALEDAQATGVLDLVLREMAGAYEAGYVHADVSEYNVFVAEDGVALFDWPQAVATDHENAEEFLRRDVTNVAGYLKRKHPNAVPEIDAESVAERIREGAFESVETGAA
ncbi:MAG: serine/threonine-protein kinase RIO2 [Halobacteriales archaeon]